MKSFPHTYRVAQFWEGGNLSTIKAAPRPPLPGGPPPEFDGPDDRWSPEHLLMASLDLCLMTTYMALAERKSLKVLRYESETRGVLDKTTEGLVFTEIVQSVIVGVAAEDKDRAGRLLDAAKKYCLVGNALKTETRLEARIEAP